MKKLLISICLIFILLMVISACSTQTSLVDTKWQLSSLAGKEPLNGVTVTLNLSKDTIGGNDGCNSFGGSYKATKTTITFGKDIYSTEMYCSDEIATQSNAFYEMLTKSATYKITSNTLSLVDANGNVLANFITSQN